MLVLGIHNLTKGNIMRNNHAVGECYKASERIDFRKTLNLHDSDNKYSWQDEEANAPAWVWAMRGLGTLGFVVGIYCLTLLAFLF